MEFHTDDCGRIYLTNNGHLLARIIPPDDDLDDNCWRARIEGYDDLIRYPSDNAARFVKKKVLLMVVGYAESIVSDGLNMMNSLK